uniref:Protein NRT1/ PTR FAMILY 7.3-like n=1 Tax=Tanacetum cinerariifolium TaxID=118510 RepID=A0A699IKW6_TANCI|nr:protein NRT1/ PTR FAMILY 7.3-like [Tanacetum cinerariifolium]
MDSWNYHSREPRTSHFGLFWSWSEPHAVSNKGSTTRHAEAANNVRKWTKTVYIFSLVGAFLSDSYWGCGDHTTACVTHSSWEIGLFYISIYMVALGYGGYQPNIENFGADQLDEENVKEGHSKDEGMWTFGFWLSTGLALFGLVLFLCATIRYRYFKPSGNPLNKICQVFVTASKKWSVKLPEGKECLFEDDKESSPTTGRKILHTYEFKFLDKAAYITSRDFNDPKEEAHNPWTLCPISQVEARRVEFKTKEIKFCKKIRGLEFDVEVKNNKIENLRGGLLGSMGI